MGDALAQAQLAGVVDILTAEDLAILMGGYSREEMINAANAATVGAYPEAAGLINFMSQHFFDPTSPWDPKLREGAIISLLTVHCNGGGLLLVVHFYWGLMEGLAVANICELLLLTGVYTGLPNFTSGVGNLKVMLLELKKLAASGDPKAVQCMNVIGQLRTLFH